MPLEANPRRISGAWDDGYALDTHTIESRLTGYNQFGHAVFSTNRTPLGELVYQLKYRSDSKCIGPIAETAKLFLERWQVRPTIIVPVPPSRTGRRNQPVLEIAKAISALCAIPLAANCVKKVKQTKQIKDVIGLAERMDALTGAFVLDSNQTAGQRVILFDDLYQSGATMNTLARLLKEDGRAQAVYALALTRTRNP